MKSPIVLITLVFAVGIAIGVFAQNAPDTAEFAADQNTVAASDNAVVIDPSTSNIAELNRLLQDEIKARKSLEQKFDALSRQVSEFTSNSQYQSTDLSDQAESAQSLDSESDSDWFNEQALVDSGMTGSQARELKVFFEQQELQQLYLRDQAIRESWDRQKYREEFQALNDEEDALKNRLGDSAYDAYLYASGQSNRVAVSSVLATAPAGTAGIQAGDHILRYNNQRIYSGFELRQATTGGNASDSVPVEVERDGQILEFYLIRGPLGIRMNSVSVAP
jgi:predicted metalloprotease with PDZ domain